MQGMGTETPWMVVGKWSVSEHNWADEVRKLMPNLPKKSEVRDVTFREADDQHGLYLTIGLSKEEIEKKLEDRRKLMPERERFNPALIGRKTIYAWGAYGSRQPKVIKAKLASMGLKYTDQDVKKVQDALAAEVERRTVINKELIAKKQVPYLVDEEFSDLIRKIIRT